MVVGIAYHSPLDIHTLLPVGSDVSLDPDSEVCFFLTDKYVSQYKAKVQIVFASLDILNENTFPILDQGPWGTIVNISNNIFEKILNNVNRKESDNDRKYKPSTSEWIWV